MKERIKIFVVQFVLYLTFISILRSENLFILSSRDLFERLFVATSLGLYMVLMDKVHKRWFEYIVPKVAAKIVGGKKR